MEKKFLCFVHLPLFLSLTYEDVARRNRFLKQLLMRFCIVDAARHGTITTMPTTVRAMLELVAVGVLVESIDEVTHTGASHKFVLPRNRLVTAQRLCISTTGVSRIRPRRKCNNHGGSMTVLALLLMRLGDNRERFASYASPLCSSTLRSIILWLSDGGERRVPLHM